MRAVIIAGGRLGRPDHFRRILRAGDTVICADGGCRNAEKLGLVPDVAIGDFDSFPEEAVCARSEKRVLPKEKDRTDTHECVLYAIERGFDEILLLGGIGSRMDHTIANINLLKVALDAGVAMKILDDHNEIFLISGEAVVPKKKGRHISLLPVGSASGIFSDGLYYPLTDSTMEFGDPYGVSNEFTKDEARIRVGSGLLLAILSRD